MPDAFATQRRRPSDPATFVFDITPDDANDLAHVTTALNVATPGTVRRALRGVADAPPATSPKRLSRSLARTSDHMYV